jgi:hypothetical protein
LRIPNAEDLDAILSQAEETSGISYDEFVVALYKATLENLGE